MKKFLKSIVFVLALTLITVPIVRCDSNDSSCQETACTLVFVTINVTIVYQNQNPVVLDSYELINLEDNSPVSLSFSTEELAQLAQQGVYPIMDDLSLDENQQLNLQFRGFLGNQEVVNENYTVAKDCCHVSLISGTTEISL
jgi:hypothetical protein